jgi:NADPH-dependent curcumin reductase CurA
MTGTEIRLASRPKGWPTLENFSTASVDLPPVDEGHVLVRNTFMSVDPYMRGRMNDVKSYVPPFEVGAALQGGAIGEVVESRDPSLQPGAIVQSMRGWRDLFVAPAKELREVDASIQPRSAHLGVLGMPGMTAWIGLFKIANLQPGERVFVSGAAGAVGSIAGQLAKLHGCFVVGSAGSADKVQLLTGEYGFDAAINYKDLPAAKDGTPASALSRALATAAPDGIDVYFDNVGGDHLEAAIACMRDHGRVAVCGSISRYNDEAPSSGPRNMFMIVTRRLTVRGFLVLDWGREMKTFYSEVAPLVASGKLKWRETVVTGLTNAPQAFIDMMKGANTGKMVVKI